MDASEKYPALMAYIANHSLDKKEYKTQFGHAWYDQLKVDEQAAFEGSLADVAADMQRAKADFSAAQKAKGLESYPYNRAMGEFLGLPILDNGEPPHGYYMASRVQDHYELGSAAREAQRLITEGRKLRVIAARSRKDGKPCRYHTFVGPEQIKVEGPCVVIQNSKVRGRLASNWSVQTCLQKLIVAMANDTAYG